jgi:ferritin-like metal-binding protein YciE
MPENTPTRDAKLVQYLNEAYALERRLETALQAHIGLAQKDALKKRLKEHLKETKQQAKALERRIKQLGGKAEAVDIPGPDLLAGAAGVAAAAAQKAGALAKGPAHALRGASAAETQLKNAKTDFSAEHEEIATYNGIIALAEALKDSDTVKLAREHLRQEERMAKFLATQIGQLAKEVARTEVPAAERRSASNGGTRRKSSSSRSTSRSSSSRSSGTSRTASSRAASASGSARKAAGKAAGTARSTTKAASTGAKSAAKSGTTSARRSAAGSKGAAKSSRARAKKS